MSESKSGKWNDNDWNNYEYSAQDNLKEYYISKKEHTQVWGNGTKEVTADVIAPVSGSTGNDRFYVMSLQDFTNNSKASFYWYYNADSVKKLNRPVATNFNDFGAGKKNTIDMINDWNNNTSTYGAQTTTESGEAYLD